MQEPGIQPGSYLVRTREKTGGYVLSFRAANEVMSHVLIKFEPQNGVYFITQVRWQKNFLSTLRPEVKFYSTTVL